MMTIYGFYEDNELVYIGKTNRPIEKRIEEHLKQCHNRDLKEIIERGRYEIKILFESDIIDEKTLCDIEKSYD